MHLFAVDGPVTRLCNGARLGHGSLGCRGRFRTLDGSGRLYPRRGRCAAGRARRFGLALLLRAGAGTRQRDEHETQRDGKMTHDSASFNLSPRKRRTGIDERDSLPITERPFEIGVHDVDIEVQPIHRVEYDGPGVTGLRVDDAECRVVAVRRGHEVELERFDPRPSKACIDVELSDRDLADHVVTVAIAELRDAVVRLRRRLEREVESEPQAPVPTGSQVRGTDLDATAVADAFRRLGATEGACSVRDNGIGLLAHIELLHRTVEVEMYLAQISQGLVDG